MKKSMIWISAVLYIALGIAAISLVLAATLPLVNNLKDKNTVIETKEIMFSIDNAIRQVTSEAPGSRRTLYLEIKKGELYIDKTMDNEGNNKIIWTMKTRSFIQEPNIIIEESYLKTYLNESIIIDEYQANLELDYHNIDLQLESSKNNPFSGPFNMVIQNNGVSSGRQIVVIKI